MIFWRGLRIIGFLILILLLTLFTQCGGVVLLLAWIIWIPLRRRLKGNFLQRASLPFLFVLLYGISTAVIIPPIASAFGRVPLPWSGNLRPETVWTCILNRHYVRPQLKRLMEDVSAKMEARYPGTHVNYFDANLPFYDCFPLWPHLSHNDGRKLDVALFYSSKNGRALHDTPSPIGYGVFVDPQKGEINYPEKCRREGYWQYGFMEMIIPQWWKSDYIFDEKRTQYFIDLLTNDQRMHIMLMEPHLKTRLKLQSAKIRYHGCHAVRHDDHVHIQLRK